MDDVMGIEGIAEMTKHENNYLLSEEDFTTAHEDKRNNDQLKYIHHNDTTDANTASNTTGRQKSRMNGLQTFFSRFIIEKQTVKKQIFFIKFLCK